MECNFISTNLCLQNNYLGIFSYFVVGIFLFLNFSNLLKHKLRIVIISISILLVSNYFSSNSNIFYPAALGSVVIIAAYRPSFLNNFGKYGDFTYGLYIFHFPIIQLFKQYDLFEKYNPFLMGFLIICITFVFALFSWFFIEKRFLDRYKQAIKMLVKTKAIVLSSLKFQEKA